MGMTESRARPFWEPDRSAGFWFTLYLGPGRAGSGCPVGCIGGSIRSQVTIRNEVDDASHLGVVMVVGGFGEKATPLDQAVPGGRILQEPEQVEGDLQVRGDRGPAEQGRTLQRHPYAAGHDVGYPLSRTRAETPHERPGEAERKALVRPLTAEAGPAGLAAQVHHLTGATGPPGAEPTQRTGVCGIGGADRRRWNVGGS